MIYGFVDESGSPGVAMYHDDYLLISMVIFETEELIVQAKNSISELKASLYLSQDYEFHCNKNSTRSQVSFIDLLSRLKFRFITIAIRKDDFRSTATYNKISRELVNIVRDNFSELKIEMDSNPTLYTEIKNQIKLTKIKNVKIYQSKSHSSDMIQIADYVANLSAKKIKNTTFAKKYYSYIKHKEMIFKIIG